jgi:hypothetical protein
VALSERPLPEFLMSDLTMPEFTLPPLRVDPGTLPPPILTSEPGSFARWTLELRIPHIIEETMALNSFPPEINRSLQELRSEILSGAIRGLHEDTQDRPFWDQTAAPWIGRGWLDVPWYWAEAFVYRRMLEATRYFQPGRWHSVDLFGPKKLEDVSPPDASRAVDEVLTSLTADAGDSLRALLYASLWGNRMDLSYAAAAELARGPHRHDERTNLLADDSALVTSYLSARPGGRIAILADNAGSELLADLVLSDFLLSSRLASQLVVYVKPHPFFVSDATAADLDPALEALRRGGPQVQVVEERIRGRLADGQLAIRTHWHLGSSLFFFQLPADLWADLAAMTLVIIKGDAAYRRLLGDAHWPPTTPFAQATAYFPAPLFALRTLKAELIVGLPPGRAEQLTREDPQWLVNARRGVLQFADRKSRG